MTGKGSNTFKDQKTAVVFAAFTAILINILVTKIMILINPSLDAHQDANMINKVVFAVLAVFFIFLIWKTPMKFELDALKVKDKKKFTREMIEAVVISLILIAGMIVWRLILNRSNPEIEARPVFGLYLGIHGRWFYPFSAVLQELFIKALMQENFRSLSQNGNKHFTVAVNGIFFAAMHMNYPLYYLIGAGLLCIGTGYLYERDRNIWGSSLIHFVIGFMPRALGLK
ncbi:MAG: CPBP family intramembrane metalloprotease [Clostridiales bacterium]|nr:CPBP family intramembrane metalloprotease [Clostridiales bacterium]